VGRGAGNPSSNQAKNEKTYLADLVTTSRDGKVAVTLGAEADAVDPTVVAVGTAGELALANSVPDLDGLVARGGDDLAVVGGERDREDVTGVANEAAGGLSALDVEKTEGLVPR